MSDFTMSAPMPEPQQESVRYVAYAGFWKRFGAYFIDGLILGIPWMIVFFVLVGSMMGSRGHYEPNGGGTMLMFPAWILGMVGSWLYFALMESSEAGATLGKRALGLRVTDLNGNRIDFARASGRYFGKIVSGVILYIGFIMAGFTDKKQALHDMMAGTLVLDVGASSGRVPSNVAEQAVKF